MKLYKCDSPHETSKILIKITDAHIYSGKVRKMKVKLAAQVMSRSFAAFMRYSTEADMCSGPTYSLRSYYFFKYIGFVLWIEDRTISFGEEAISRLRPSVGKVEHFAA